MQNVRVAGRKLAVSRPLAIVVADNAGERAQAETLCRFIELLIVPRPACIYLQLREGRFNILPPADVFFVNPCAESSSENRPGRVVADRLEMLRELRGGTEPAVVVSIAPCALEIERELQLPAFRGKDWLDPDGGLARAGAELFSLLRDELVPFRLH